LPERRELPDANREGFVLHAENRGETQKEQASQKCVVIIGLQQADEDGGGDRKQRQLGAWWICIPLMSRVALNKTSNNQMRLFIIVPEREFAVSDRHTYAEATPSLRWTIC
jgi:hypothetical protein